MASTHEGKFSMPIKQSYNSHIKESREHDTQELLYEFFDDFSYSNASFACIHLLKNKRGEVQLYLSMEHGPIELENMSKILQWRLSGTSQEKGHKGGGNKRLIYGHCASKVILHSVINDEEFIRAETKPDEIYLLSCDSTISEGDFQIKVDREHIKWPTDILRLEEDGAWFKDYITDMRENEQLNIGYVIRLTLSKPRKEYIDMDNWKYLISLIQMKNYTIPIYFKNELLGETEFMTYPTTDIIGLEHKKIDTEQVMDLFINDKDDVTIRLKDTYINSKGDEVPFNETMIRIGPLNLYQIDGSYLKTELVALNKLSNKIGRSYTQEDFYGIYIRINNKQTNYLPVTGILPPSKNLSELGNSLYRLVISPECCDDVLERFITTDTIKAKTRFKDINKAKKIMSVITKIAKGTGEVLAQPEVTKFKEISVKGQCYIISFGEGLYKYGLVTGTDKMDKRMNEHLRESIKNVKEFCNIETKEKYCKAIHYTTPLSNPKGFEERIGQILEENQISSSIRKIQLFQNRQSEHEHREYFTCDDDEYMLNVILPLIIREQQEY